MGNGSKYHFAGAGKVIDVGKGGIRGSLTIICPDSPEPEFREEFGGFSVFFRKGKLVERVADKLGETEGKILVLIAGDKLISIPVMAEKLGISTGI